MSRFGGSGPPRIGDQPAPYTALAGPSGPKCQKILENWSAANGGVTNGGLRGVWPPVLEIGRNRPFSPFFLPFSPFSGGPEEHLGNRGYLRRKAFFLSLPRISLNPHLLNPHLRHPKKMSPDASSGLVTPKASKSLRNSPVSDSSRDSRLLEVARPDASGDIFSEPFTIGPVQFIGRTPRGSVPPTRPLVPLTGESVSLTFNCSIVGPGLGAFECQGPRGP